MLLTTEPSLRSCLLSLFKERGKLIYLCVYVHVYMEVPTEARRAGVVDAYEPPDVGAGTSTPVL